MREEHVDEHRGLDSVRDQARMSALFLYRMLQKGYSHVMSAVLDEEGAQRQRAREDAAAALSAAVTAAASAPKQEESALTMPKLQEETAAGRHGHECTQHRCQKRTGCCRPCLDSIRSPHCVLIPPKNAQVAAGHVIEEEHVPEHKGAGGVELATVIVQLEEGDSSSDVEYQAVDEVLSHRCHFGDDGVQNIMQRRVRAWLV